MSEWLQARRLRHAFERVRENHGCAGADDISLAGFKSGLAGQIELLRGMVEDQSYFALKDFEGFRAAVQYSVFECNLHESALEELMGRLEFEVRAPADAAPLLAELFG